MMMTITHCDEIDDYINGVEDGSIIASADVVKLCRHVREVFENEDVYVDTELLASYVRIGNTMFDFVMDWQKFLCACLLCTFKGGITDRVKRKPRWHEAFIMLGRGGGKDGTIAWFSVCLTSKFNPVPKYDVDICANNEEQSTRPVKDVVEFLEKPALIAKNKKAYHWTKEETKGLKNGGRIKGHTNSPSGRDGLRSGIVVLNEIHAMTSDLANVNVFTTGLGKKPQPRMMYFTTNGDLREGLLDTFIEDSAPVLNGDTEDNGFFYYICRLDSKEEVHDEKNWNKANPSLKYFDTLLDETRREYRKWLESPHSLTAFMTKRMNLPDSASAHAICDYSYIKDTNKPIPDDLKGKPCICGIDLSRTTDMCSVSLYFKRGDKRYAINHNWICRKSQDWDKIRVKDHFPEWVDMGLLTIVEEDEIHPKLIANYIQQMKQDYYIVKCAIDDFRQSLFSMYLAEIGFSKEAKNLKVTRNNDIAKVVPKAERYFLNGYFYFGNNPVMRWSINNTKVVPYRTQNTSNADLGNFIYGKIEHRSRKTDAWMSVVQAMCCEDELAEAKSFIGNPLFRVRTY